MIWRGIKRPIDRLELYRNVIFPPQKQHIRRKRMRCALRPISVASTLRTHQGTIHPNQVLRCTIKLSAVARVLSWLVRTFDVARFFVVFAAENHQGLDL